MYRSEFMTQNEIDALKAMQNRNAASSTQAFPPQSYPSLPFQHQPYPQPYPQPYLPSPYPPQTGLYPNTAPFPPQTAQDPGPGAMVPFKKPDTEIRCPTTLTSLDLYVQHGRTVESLHEVAKAGQRTEQRLDALIGQMGKTESVPKNMKRLPADVSKIMPVPITSPYPKMDFQHPDQRVMDFYIEKKKEYRDDGNSESIAHAFAEDAANEYAEELSKKKQRLIGPPAAGPAAAGPAFDANIHADMQAAQAFTPGIVKDLLLKHKHIRNKTGQPKKEYVTKMTNITKTFGLLHYLTINDIDPFAPLAQDTLDAFTQYKVDHGMPIDDDWDGNP